MRVILWLSALLLSTAAVAQTKPTIPQSGHTDQGAPFATLRDLAGVFALYADYSGLQAEIARALAAETAVTTSLSSKCSVMASACTVTPLNATLPLTLGALFGDTYVVPDWYRLPADGTDDAPAIRRAQATGMPLHFRCRHYNISSPSTFTTRLQWSGCGNQGTAQNSALGAAATFGGTWLDVDVSFSSAPVAGTNSGQSPITISGTSTANSVIQDMAISQVHPYPPNGDVTWTPNSYAYMISVLNTGGEFNLRSTFWLNITNGVKSINSGRLTVDGFRGQFFNNAILVNDAHDVVRLTDLHIWPYWADVLSAEIYTQQNLDTVILGRADTPFISRLFTIPANSGIKFVNFGTGVTSGASLSSISCDFTKYCIWAEGTSSGVTFQLSDIRSYAQQYVYSTVTSTTMIPNSSVIQVDGQIYSAQIGSIVNFGTRTATISFPNATLQSRMQIGSISVENSQFSDPNTWMTVFGPNGSAVYLATTPLVSGTRPSGYVYSNNPSSGGLFMPTYSKVTTGP